MRDDRLVIEAPGAQLTVSIREVQYVSGASTEIELVVDDDTTGDSEHGFGCTATARLSIDQLKELRDFLNQILKRDQKT